MLLPPGTRWDLDGAVGQTTGSGEAARWFRSIS
jgi:hypothetical protein